MKKGVFRRQATIEFPIILVVVGRLDPLDGAVRRREAKLVDEAVQFSESRNVPRADSLIRAGHHTRLGVGDRAVRSTIVIEIQVAGARAPRKPRTERFPWIFGSRGPTIPA